MFLPLDNEKELLLQVAEGDEIAFRKIYDRYRKKIAAFTYLLTESADVTDEIVQEVFIKLWYRRGKLGDVINFNAWLHTVTRNLVIDAMKKQARESLGKKELLHTLTSSGHYTDEIIFSRESTRILQDAVEQLSPQQKIIYNLSRNEGLKNEEIAGRLNISIMTVKNHLVNAMRTIREYFRLHATLVMAIILFHLS